MSDVSGRETDERAPGRPLVLLVDDDAAHRRLLRTAFELDGWTVDEADNGYSGAVLAAARLPELLVLDLMMPVMGGFASLEVLRSLGVLDEVTVVVLSGVDDGPILRRAGRSFGVRDVVTKPVVPDEFVRRCSVHAARDVLLTR